MAEVVDSPERTSTEAIDGSLNNNRLKVNDGLFARTIEQRFSGMAKILQDALKSVND